MNNIVSTETAIRLRDAGFPQPEFEFGQLWESESGRNLAFVGTAQFVLLKQQYHLKEIVFRPTAGDILRAIYNHFASMPGFSVDIRLSPTENGFYVDVFEALPFDTRNKVWEFHENAAEAAALAWLKTREK